MASENSLGRWASNHGVTDPGRFREVRRGSLRGGGVRLPESGRRLLEDLEGFLAAKVHRGYAADRVRGRGKRTLLGLFAAYHTDPTLLEDHVLLRFKEAAGVGYLRDRPSSAVEAELARHYRANPSFVRLLADHLAGMTDTYALREHARLLRMGAVPIPSVEQLRREKKT